MAKNKKSITSNPAIAPTDAELAVARAADANVGTRVEQRAGRHAATMPVIPADERMPLDPTQPQDCSDVTHCGTCQSASIAPAL